MVSANSVSETQTGPLGSDNNGAFFQPSRNGLDRTTAAGINLGTCTVVGSVITANSSSRSAVTADLGNYICFDGITQRFEVTSVTGGQYTLDTAPGVTGVNAVLGGPGATYNFIVSLNSAANVCHYLKCLYTLVSGAVVLHPTNSPTLPASQLQESSVSGIAVDDYFYVMPGGNCLPGRYRVLSIASGRVNLSKALNLVNGNTITNICYIVKPAKVTQRYAVTSDNGAAFGIAGAGCKLIGYNTSRSVMEFATAPILFKTPTGATWTVGVYDVAGGTYLENLLVDRENGVSTTQNLVYNTGARFSHLKNATAITHQGAGISNLYESEPLVVTTRSGSTNSNTKSNCVALWLSTGFNDNFEATSCIAVDCTTGFASNAYTSENCTAFNCTTGFHLQGRAVNRNLLAVNCTTGFNFSSVGPWRGDEKLAHFGCTTPFTGSPGGIASPLIALSAMPLIDPANGDFRPKPGVDGDALKYYESIPQHTLASPPQHDKWIGALSRTESIGSTGILASGDRRNGGGTY